MATKYKMVRLREKTHLSLLTLARMWQDAANEGKLPHLPTNRDGLVSLDSTVEELIRRDWGHRQRASTNTDSKRAVADQAEQAHWTDGRSS